LLAGDGSWRGAGATRAGGDDDVTWVGWIGVSELTLLVYNKSDAGRKRRGEDVDR
jgi:hypothetical protein